MNTAWASTKASCSLGAKHAVGMNPCEDSPTIRQRQRPLAAGIFVAAVAAVAAICVYKAKNKKLFSIFKDSGNSGNSGNKSYNKNYTSPATSLSKAWPQFTLEPSNAFSSSVVKGNFFVIPCT